MIKDDFLPAILIVFVKWTIFSHVAAGKHVVIKIQVPKLINHQHHTNVVLVHKYKKPTHHHVVPHHHDDHHYHHHHYGHSHHHGHHHHHGKGGDHHKGGHQVHNKHHKTSHGKPPVHHHSHSYGHHHHVTFNHGHPPVHHKPKHFKPATPKKDSKPQHKPSHYKVGSFFDLANAYKQEFEKQNQPKDEQFETITEVPINSDDFQVENIKTSPEVSTGYEVHEDHPQDYSNDFQIDNFDYPLNKDAKQNEELNDYTEDYTNPFSVSKFTSNIEHGSINLEKTHYNPDHESEISGYINEYNESDYDT